MLIRNLVYLQRVLLMPPKTTLMFAYHKLEFYKMYVDSPTMNGTNLMSPSAQVAEATSQGLFLRTALSGLLLNE